MSTAHIGGILGLWISICEAGPRKYTQVAILEWSKWYKVPSNNHGRFQPSLPTHSSNERIIFEVIRVPARADEWVS
ncbi:hypothetical protein C8Q69DRAFT_45049 [Paecilomyces variotii]|uniref:Peptidase S54 rhomboid domain-containing protein n=1 Tax=Byssochlamys spectabilis TaxID=264951 RepID=A0A443I7E4_BYSSP|nr:hypothetical protein C8Q69DRAFT_45049 [Paecilomyces variotii]RWR00010.1 hypothetical protein C8Q69DRAFT_45049 [Paecilomyces variotii]